MIRFGQLKRDSARARKIVLNRLVNLAGTRKRDDHVLVFHTGRSGSTVLGDLLMQNSEVYWGGETLERHVHKMKQKTSRNITDQFGSYSIEDAVSIIKGKLTGRAGGKMFGVEIQDYHLDMFNADLEDLISRLRELGFTRYILIDRRNQLRKVVSHLVATTLKEHHVDQGEKRSCPRIFVDVDDVFVGYRRKKLFEVVDGYVRFFDRLRKILSDEPVLNLCYEDDIERDPRLAYLKTCEFLGIEPDDTEVRFGKTTNFPVSQIIGNIEEVEECFAGTPYAWMTEDSPAGAA